MIVIINNIRSQSVDWGRKWRCFYVSRERKILKVKFGDFFFSGNSWNRSQARMIYMSDKNLFPYITLLNLIYGHHSDDNNKRRMKRGEVLYKVVKVNDAEIKDTRELISSSGFESSVNIITVCEKNYFLMEFSSRCVLKISAICDTLNSLDKIVSSEHNKKCLSQIAVNCNDLQVNIHKDWNCALSRRAR